MNLTPIWGSLVVLLICPLLGGLPIIDWITYGITGHDLKQRGTGNVSVSAAFYHGGKVAGILAVLSEAAKGIIAVWLARAFFSPAGSVWEIIALIALVIGRYWMGKGAGTTNVVWGIVAHDAIAAGIIFLISLVSFTIIRDRQFSKYGALICLAVIIGLRHPERPEYAVAAAALGILLAGIYRQIPDDLDLIESEGAADTKQMFRFFRGDRTITTLYSKLDAGQVGAKAATLSKLKRLGYPVPDGWVLRPGDDLKSVVSILKPSETEPLIVRSSAIGEDSETASAAGQYLSIPDITSTEALQAAILSCQASYLENNAAKYRRDLKQVESGMAVLIQKQIAGTFSGVAFSRDPVDCLRDDVAIEALPGKASKVVSGRFTPQRYRVSLARLSVEESERGIAIAQENSSDSSVDIPTELLESVALLAREMEDLFDGIPQDLEWTYDGEKLWLLQVRPITTLQPIWTRRIAAEVIPGKIRPLTWSINRPLTCGVWGKLFAVVLGDKARDLDFNQTATLHFASAYFNATLLGQIFRRMGLPAESLEFLTRGAKFTKPPLMTTIKNLPGLWRLFKREWNLTADFESDRVKLFAPILSAIETQPLDELSSQEILARIDTILELLDKATYYNILAPLSLSLRQAILKVPETELDNTQIPEIKSVQALADMASETCKLLATERITMDSSASLFAHIAENPEGESIIERFDRWLDNYGYLSEVATDIAVPRWRDNPAVPREMFARFFFDRERRRLAKLKSETTSGSWKSKIIQTRINLKGQVSEVYNKLLAHLRWSFVALERLWLDSGIIHNSDDIFLLNFDEINRLPRKTNEELKHQLPQLIDQRKRQWQYNCGLKPVPALIYGQPDPSGWLPPATFNSQQQLTGIGTSSGQVEGSIKIISSLQNAANINSETIIVVPYTDAGWSPLLARAGGLISEVGGRLSHGAIVAREYHIPAVMDIANATQLFKDGQRVRINGQTGVVEILE